MFWAVAGLCVTFAIMASIGPLGAVALGLLLVSIAIHVIGNAIGTRLREIGSSRRDQFDVVRPRAQPVASHEFAPTTQLSRRRRLGWLLDVTMAIGFLAGAGSGGWLLLETYGDRITPMRLSIGGFAFGLIGAFLGFLIGAFSQVIVGALWEALRQSRGKK